MPDISLHCEPDGLLAFLSIADGIARKISIQELHTLLKRHRIIFGVDENMLKEVASGVRRGERIPVASGKPMEPGNPGRLEWFIDLSKVGKPRELEDGRVDLRDLQFDLNVRKGEKLVRRIPPVPGTSGTTIFGRFIDPPQPEDVHVVAGKGTEYIENDRDCIIAVIDGAVIFDGRTVEVHNQKVINRDIDYATGNVFFNGDLKITGSVRAGFSVNARGDIHINGNVEDCEIKSGGSVIVQGGATGSGSGNITCGGSIKLHHVAKFTLSAGKNIIIQENILHTTVLAEGNVTAKAIIGGSVSAFSINTEITGSNAETRTVIDVTRAAQLTRERYNLFKRFGTMMAERVSYYDKMFILVRDGMDEKGLLRYNDLQELELLKQNTLESIKTADTIQARLEKIDELEKDRQGDSSVNIGIAYPNTVIKINNEERLIKEEQKNLFLTSARK